MKLSLFFVNFTKVLSQVTDNIIRMKIITEAVCMKALSVIFTLAILLQGCVSPTAGSAVTKGDDYLYYYIAHSVSQADINNEKNDPAMTSESTGYGQQYTFNGEKSLILSNVVSKMAEQLLSNYEKKFHNESIALTSLVDLNDHQKTSWLGQTISEQFIHELHIRKLRVVDFKLTGNIQVTAAGEFAMSRDWTKLNKNVDVTRILTGTISRNEEGVILNVRIVNAANSVVESTSSAFIPQQMFVESGYDYQRKRYISRNNTNKKGQTQVRLVK